MDSQIFKFIDLIERKFRIDAKYFFSGGIWLGMGQIITILFGLVTTALFAHFLNENDYGVYRYLVGLAAIFSVFSLTGLGQSILQTAAKGYRGFYRETLRTNLLYSSGIFLLSISGAGYYWFNDNVTLSLGCLFIAILQPITRIFQFTHSFLQGSKRFKESTRLHGVQMFFVSAISFVSLLFTQNILSLFVAYLLAQFFSSLFAYLYYKPSKEMVPQGILNKYFQYAKHTSIQNVISNIAQKLDTVIVFTQLGAAELALYSIATVVPEQIKGSLKNLTTLLIPKYAKHESTDILIRSLSKRSLQLLSILILITIGYILLSPYAYHLLFPKYPDAIFYSQLAALAFPTFILFIPYSIIRAGLQEKILYKITIWTSLIQITTLIIGVTFFGIIGAIISKVIYRFSFLILSYYFVYKK